MPVDIPVAFIQGDQEEMVHMWLEGTLAKLLTKCDQKLYKKYIVMESHRPILYVELMKALYGTLLVALIFWCMLTAKLTEWGYTINLCDWCMANKQTNGHQCTFIWHVDNMKFSHVDSKLVDHTIKMLKEKYGKEHCSPFSVVRNMTI